MIIPIYNKNESFTLSAGYRGRKGTYAVVMELADMQDLGSCAARRVGSSPTNRIDPL